MYVCVCVCVCVCACVCVHACMYACMYACMHACTITFRNIDSHILGGCYKLIQGPIWVVKLLLK